MNDLFMYEKPLLIAAMFHLCNWAFPTWEVFTGTCCLTVSLHFILFSRSVAEAGYMNIGLLLISGWSVVLSVFDH